MHFMILQQVTASIYAKGLLNACLGKTVIYISYDSLIMEKNGYSPIMRFFLHMTYFAAKFINDKELCLIDIHNKEIFC